MFNNCNVVGSRITGNNESNGSMYVDIYRA
jgi:hypothetical protein